MQDSQSTKRNVIQISYTLIHFLEIIVENIVSSIFNACNDQLKRIIELKANTRERIFGVFYIILVSKMTLIWSKRYPYTDYVIGWAVGDKNTVIHAMFQEILRLNFQHKTCALRRNSTTLYAHAEKRH